MHSSESGAPRKHVTLHTPAGAEVGFDVVLGADPAEEELRLRAACHVQPWARMRLVDRATGSGAAGASFEDLRDGQHLDVHTNQAELLTVRRVFERIEATHEGRVLTSDLRAALLRESTALGAIHSLAGRRAPDAEKLVQLLDLEPNPFMSWIELEFLCDQVLEASDAPEKVVELRHGEDLMHLTLQPSSDILDTLAEVRGRFGLHGAFRVLDDCGGLVLLAHASVTAGARYEVRPGSEFSHQRLHNRPNAAPQVRLEDEGAKRWVLWMGDEGVRRGDAWRHRDPAVQSEIVLADRARYSEMRRYKGWVELRDDCSGAAVVPVKCREADFVDPGGPCHVKITYDPGTPGCLYYSTDYCSTPHPFSELGYEPDDGVAVLRFHDIGKSTQLPLYDSHAGAEMLGRLRYLCETAGVAHDIPSLLTLEDPQVFYMELSTGRTTADRQKTPFARRTEARKVSSREQKMRRWQSLLGGRSATASPPPLGAGALVAAAARCRLRRDCDAGVGGLVCHVTGVMLHTQSREGAAEAAEQRAHRELVAAGVPPGRIAFSRPQLSPPGAGDLSPEAAAQRAAYNRQALECCRALQEGVLRWARAADGTANRGSTFARVCEALNDLSTPDPGAAV